MTAKSQQRKINKLCRNKLGISIREAERELLSGSKKILERRSKATTLKLHHEITMVEIRRCNLILDKIKSQGN